MTRGSGLGIRDSGLGIRDSSDSRIWRQRSEIASDPGSRVPDPESRQASLWAHAEGAVESDDFSVQHLVLEDVPDERPVLLGSSESRGEGHLLRQ